MNVHQTLVGTEVLASVDSTNTLVRAERDGLAPDVNHVSQALCALKTERN